jgi:hypothetical protein
VKAVPDPVSDPLFEPPGVMSVADVGEPGPVAVPVATGEVTAPEVEPGAEPGAEPVAVVTPPPVDVPVDGIGAPVVSTFELDADVIAVPVPVPVGAGGVEEALVLLGTCVIAADVVDGGVDGGASDDTEGSGEDDEGAVEGGGGVVGSGGDPADEPAELPPPCR